MLDEDVDGTSSVVRYVEAYLMNAPSGYLNGSIFRDIKGAALGWLV
jgi:hypothetical protein